MFKEALVREFSLLRLRQQTHVAVDVEEGALNLTDDKLQWFQNTSSAFRVHRTEKHRLKTSTIKTQIIAFKWQGKY